MNSLLNKSKPLLIHGLPGSGKTQIALEIAKDMVLTKIDSSMLKSIKTKDYLLDIVKKKNITLMFSEKKENRCLIIDDIHIFQKFDKSFFKSVIEFIKNERYYQTYIILTCNNSFLKNKELIKIKKYLNYHEIKYSYSQYYKICLKISKDNHYNYTLDELDKKIYFSGYNFNNYISSCEENKINIKDNFNSIEIVTKDLINNSYEMKELFRLCEGDEIILSYNLLENLEKIVKLDLKSYYKIYQSIVNADVIEYNIVKEDKESSIKYMTILSIAIVNYHINMKCNNIISNRYISKCMVLANKRYSSELGVLIYLIDSILKHDDKEYKENPFLNNKKKIERVEKIYDFFY